MDTFDTLDELWLDAADFVLEDGQDVPSRDGFSREVCGYAARLANPWSNFMFNPVRNMSAAYAAGEFIWYLSGSDKGEHMVAYAKQYERFLESDGHAHGAYGYRLGDEATPPVPYGNGPMETDRPGGYSQFHQALRTLAKHPLSRQVILQLWDFRRDLAATETLAFKDIPCTLTLQLLQRDGKLNMIVNMRSNDLWLGLPYDVFCFTTLQQIIAMALKLDVGWYQHQAGSLHVYDRNMEKFKEAASPGSFKTGSLDYVNPWRHHPAPGECVYKANERLCKMEEFIRTHAKCTSDSIRTEFGNWSHLHAQLLVMASSKWSPNAAKYASNSLMKKVLERQTPRC